MRWPLLMPWIVFLCACQPSGKRLAVRAILPHYLTESRVAWKTFLEEFEKVELSVVRQGQVLYHWHAETKPPFDLSIPSEILVPENGPLRVVVRIWGGRMGTPQLIGHQDLSKQTLQNTGESEIRLILRRPSGSELNRT